jgi:hypothetical protein
MFWLSAVATVMAATPATGDPEPVPAINAPDSAKVA